ncbi:P-loop containing nucleoside triphosphate hydrolase protein [Dactylonectria estremocensis]|uniref:Kinesin-like protein n=1 Tax=Dactylonectria estremocensis TaxID=1079267 RepID=A0A9P9F313_9HYPO|nr:P-loop containing nucleoside triphosphate hydrolase protein [Dactylonectria estremocensis]
MEQFIAENSDRYQSLVTAFKPPKSSRPASASAPTPGMVVTTRLRPLLDDETAAKLPPALFPRSDQPGVLDVHELRQSALGPPQLKSANFQVDRVYDTDSNTEHIYQDVVKPLVPWAWNGGIGTLFAYGQTGSGKTYTISRLERLVADELLSGSFEGQRNVYVTIIELAGNAAHDLLNTRRPVSILEDSFGITQLTGALEHQVTTADEMLAFVDTATAFRRTESTVKNDASSRSHAICRIRVQNLAAPEAEDGVLYLIDLAGSEAARDSAAHGAQRMKETREINTSLSVLKDCIRGKAESDALAGSSSKRKPHVPFRQSALTKVLKHVFDPAALRPCKTVVVACVNPCLADVGPSKNTLRYAETLRVLVPKAKPMRHDPKSPRTWTNERLREWIKENSGTPPIDASILAPTESGAQLLRLPTPEFESRCLKTPDVTPEQAKAFWSKFWQMHIDAQHASAKATSVPDSDTMDLLQRSSSQDPNPKALSVPFKERIRPGMAVKWTPPPGFPMALPGMNLAVVLCPAPAVDEGVKDVLGNQVNLGQDDKKADTGSKGIRYLCAMVTPAVMSEAYDVHLWRQIVVEDQQMDAEVFLEYDVATRYYYMTI